MFGSSKPYICLVHMTAAAAWQRLMAENRQYNTMMWTESGTRIQSTHPCNRR